MALMLSKTYTASLAAGASENEAREAAEEIAAYENRLGKIETDLVRIQADISAIRDTMATTMATKSWVLSAMLAQTFAILGGVAGLLRMLH